jgi:hypothetical protein
MTKDPIVEEIREIRDAWARKFAYDLDAIYEDIKRRERERQSRPITFEPRPTTFDVHCDRNTP